MPTALGKFTHFFSEVIEYNDRLCRKRFADCSRNVSLGFQVYFISNELLAVPQRSTMCKYCLVTRYGAKNCEWKVVSIFVEGGDRSRKDLVCRPAIGQAFTHLL